MYNFAKLIRFSVIVPVLSVQITEALPNVSTVFICFTTIPSFIIDAIAKDSATATVKLVQLLESMGQLLQMQMVAFQSPLIIQLVMQFFAEYIRRYLDADASLYSPIISQLCPTLFTFNGNIFVFKKYVILCFTSAFRFILFY